MTYTSIIGIPTETKTAEYRVALTPTHTHELIMHGTPVHIQAGAGVGAGFEDDAYRAAGCTIQPNAKQLYAAATHIIKVKEPTAEDLKHLTKNHTLFCYLHLAGLPDLTKKLCKLGLTAYAYETLVKEGTTPLLAPMSTIAGRLSIQLGARFLHSHQGGRGVLLGGLGDDNPKTNGRVTVIGAGQAGVAAALLAANMGAHVTVLDISKTALSRMPKHANITPVLNENNLPEILLKTDLLIGAVYITGQKAPIVVTEENIKTMPKGSIAVDIAIDQGGCFETSKPCTHHKPTFTTHGIIHSAITNLPAAVPRTASIALAEATLPYIQQLVQNKRSLELKTALNIQHGQLILNL